MYEIVAGLNRQVRVFGS